jgi:antitoxin HicB
MMNMRDDEVARQVERILQRPYHRVITGDAKDGYLGEVPELPGCFTAGATPQETLENLDEAMALWLEVAIREGDPIPEPARALQIA